MAYLPVLSYSSADLNADIYAVKDSWQQCWNVDKDADTAASAAAAAAAAAAARCCCCCPLLLLLLALPTLQHIRRPYWIKITGSCF
jgi:hypothetical protein